MRVVHSKFRINGDKRWTNRLCPACLSEWTNDQTWTTVISIALADSNFRHNLQQI